MAENCRTTCGRRLSMGQVTTKPSETTSINKDKNNGQTTHTQAAERIRTALLDAWHAELEGVEVRPSKRGEYVEGGSDGE